MEIGSIVQIRIPERWKDADYYKFNNYIGEVVELTGFEVNGYEECIVKIFGTHEIFWPVEWLVEYEENDEPIETVGLNELWRN